MPVEYVALAHRFSEVNADKLRLPRLLQVLEASWLDSAVTPVAMYADKDGEYAEIVVLDVECDAIPSRNPLGLRSPERFAIMMGEDQSVLPAVLALRKDFPENVHANATRRGEAKWLCLYLAPARDVYRTWTGAGLLRQLRWWLIQTAQGTLHGTDQPLELPFFESKWEIIVPPDLERVRRQADVKFALKRVQDMAAEGGTMLLQVQPGATDHPAQFGVGVINAPPAVQTGRLRLPFSLCDLDEEFSTRNGNLSDVLRTCLGQLPEGGMEVAGASTRFVLLVNFPIVREAGGAVEAIQQIALVAGEGRLSLGAKLGLYDIRGGVANNYALIGDVRRQEGDWRQIQVAHAAVLVAPNSEAFRHYSGLSDVGPKNGVLIGAGSLGGELLHLWMRAGWGEWSVVDPDHVKPHNLARHIGSARDIGRPKVVACDEFVAEIFGEKKLKNTLVVDATDVDNEALMQLLDAADLVVDCSTKLDFPRQSSRNKRLGRHVSVFLTPSGKGSVLLAEDSKRTTRLATLEAQYYRAIISNDWGAKHLERHLGSFWSGASCRDISYELPFSSVVIQAGTVAESLRRAVGSEDASIRIWERDVVTGAITTRAIETAAGHSWSLEPLSVHSDQGLLAHLRKMRVDALPNETGGILVGYHDMSSNEVFIVDALPAPGDSKHGHGHFERGVEGIKKRLEEIQDRTANMVSYIGEWHSHPKDHCAEQSLEDRVQAAILALGMADDGLPFLQLIVGEHEIRVHGVVAKGL